MEHPENSAEYAGLQVNSGVEQPSIINPYLKRNRFRRRELSVAEMVEGIVKGDITILSQAVTLVESVNPDHQAKAQEVINKYLALASRQVSMPLAFMYSKSIVDDWPSWPSTPAASVPRVASWVTRHAWRNSACIQTRSSALVQQQALWVA